jgi:hypothetical protein
MRLLLGYTTPFKVKYTPVERHQEKTYAFQNVCDLMISPAVIQMNLSDTICLPVMKGEATIELVLTVQV